MEPAQGAYKKQRIGPQNFERNFFRPPFSDDLALELFRALPIRDIQSASTTCRHFRQIAFRDATIKTKLFQHNIFQKCIKIFQDCCQPESASKHLLSVIKQQVHNCVEEAVLTAGKMEDKSLHDDGLLMIGHHLLERHLLSRAKEIGKSINDSYSRSEFFYHVGVKELESSPHTAQATARMIDDNFQRDCLLRKIALKKLERNSQESMRIAQNIGIQFLQSEILCKATVKESNPEQTKEVLAKIIDGYWYQRACNSLNNEDQPPSPIWEDYEVEERQLREESIKMHALEALEKGDIAGAKQWNREIRTQKDYNAVVAQIAIKEAAFDIELALSELLKVKDEPDRSRGYIQDQIRLGIIKALLPIKLEAAKKVINDIGFAHIKFLARCFLAKEERMIDPDLALKNVGRAREEARRNEVPTLPEYREAIFQIALTFAKTDQIKAKKILGDSFICLKSGRMALERLEAHFDPDAAFERTKKAIEDSSKKRVESDAEKCIRSDAEKCIRVEQADLLLYIASILNEKRKC